MGWGLSKKKDWENRQGRIMGNSRWQVIEVRLHLESGGDQRSVEFRFALQSVEVHASTEHMLS